ncbi:MAG: TlpA family protein disulfide reductase [Planctomycetales bacterium]
MTPSLLTVALLSMLATPWSDSPALELRYTGALHKAGQGADTNANAVKRFNLYCAVSREADGGRRLDYVLNERGGGGWAWPERFGSIALNEALQPQSGGALRLLFEYEGNPLVIPLQLPVAEYHARLKPGAKWTEGRENWETVQKAKSQERDCWQVQVANNFGRKRTVWVDQAVPLLVALEEKVFVGQGDEHALTMQLEAVKPLDDKQFASDTQPLAALLKLRTDLQRADNEFRPELSAAQLKIAGEALPQLQKSSADTPFSALVSAISKDVKSQLERSDEVARLAEKLVGKPAPSYSLTLIDRTQVAANQSQGKITVLHFWEYQSDPLVEPYGQVGYLDFLYGKRRKLGVQVYGVAVDGRLGDPQTSGAAIKSIQQLKQFMNLSYGVALDDGKLLSKFGDPRRFDAKLPLWVVIGADGNIAHYQTGFYKINPDEGLQQLDEVLVKLIREKKEKGD